MSRLKTLVYGLLALAALILVSGAPVPRASATSFSPAAAPAPALAAPNACWDPLCYRTGPQIDAYLQGVASSYPGVAALIDTGLSWEGSRHLYALRMTNAQRPGPKPVLYLLAGQRPRDITGPEMLLRFAGYLAARYGHDPDVTWLVDSREIWLLPLANPDGYYQVYANAQCLRFKNTDNDDGCASALTAGTDLNRNYPFQWNTGGASPNPCDNSYPGPSALSEPESAHILQSIAASGAGLVAQLQGGGPSPFVRYPWGYTSAPPDAAAGFDALAWNLGRLNGTSRAAVQQHWQALGGPISGILDDTLYGQMGVPAFTLGIGDSPGVVCGALDPLWQAQLPALLYAAKVVAPDAPTTFARSFGPVASSLAVTPGPTPNSVTLTAVLSASYGTVQGAVYKVDEPGADGSGLPMSGSFGGGTANVSAVVDTATIPGGRHLLFVQGRDASGRWGVLSSTFFTVTNPQFTPTITPTPEATLVPTLTSTATPTPTRTPAPTYTPTITSTPTRTRTFTVTPTATSSGTATRTPSPTRTDTSTRTPTQTRTPTPTHTPRPPSTATPLPCADYSDVYPSQYFYRAVDWLTCREIVSGYADGTFRPYNPATRAQFVKMAVLGEGWFIYTPSQPTFADVQPGDWYYGVIETAFLHGIIAGYEDGTFRPHNSVTRAQLCKIIVLARGWTLLDPEVPHFSDVPRGSVFYSFVETAQSRGVVSGYGDGTFRPGLNATRGQLSKMLYNALTQEADALNRDCE